MVTGKEINDIFKGDFVGILQREITGNSTYEQKGNMVATR